MISTIKIREEQGLIIAQYGHQLTNIENEIDNLFQIIDQMEVIRLIGQVL
jgi:hypothetical protein